MIAFNFFGRPVYRYGIFYGITFLFGYFFLSYIGKLPIIKQFSHLQKLLSVDLDTFVLIVIGAIMVGGRLGHVFLYDWTYYSDHLGEIMNFRDGGMSFIGGVIAVVLVLLYVWKRWKLTGREFMLLGDLVLSIVPLGILLGRWGNMLNKELYGKVIIEGEQGFAFFKQRGLLYDYGIDGKPTLRINTNIIQSIGEGLIPFLVAQGIIRGKYIKNMIRPGLISGLFFIIYAIVRFFVEFAKELPEVEMYGMLSISQRLMIFFFLAGIYILHLSKKV